MLGSVPEPVKLNCFGQVVFAAYVFVCLLPAFAIGFGSVTFNVNVLVDVEPELSVTETVATCVPPLFNPERMVVPLVELFGVNVYVVLGPLKLQLYVNVDCSGSVAIAVIDCDVIGNVNDVGLDGDVI